MQKYRLVFFGTPPFALPSLEALVKNPAYQIEAVVTQPDRPTGRGQKAKSSPVKQMAEGLGLRVLTPERIKNNPEFLEGLKELAPDLIIVTAYGKILPEELLTIPKFGALNIHASFLPRHRGASPIQGAILAGDKKTGITLMKMVLEVDAGPILAQSQPISIEETDTAGSLSERLALLGAELLSQNLPGYLAGILPQIPQDNRLATYTKLIKKGDAHINWQKEASEIAREIRAYNPHPVAFTFWDSPRGRKKLLLYQAEAKKQTDSLRAGEVVCQDKEILVGTGEGGGVVLIQKLQLEGRRPLLAPEFIRGQKEFSGSILN